MLCNAIITQKHNYTKYVKGEKLFPIFKKKNYYKYKAQKHNYNKYGKGENFFQQMTINTRPQKHAHNKYGKGQIY